MNINILEIFMVVPVVIFSLFSNKKVINFLNKHSVLIWPFEKLKDHHIAPLKASMIFSFAGLLWFDLFIRLVSRYSYDIYSSSSSFLLRLNKPALLYFSQNYLFLGLAIIFIFLGLSLFILPLAIFSKLLREELSRPKVKT